MTRNKNRQITVVEVVFQYIMEYLGLMKTTEAYRRPLNIELLGKNKTSWIFFYRIKLYTYKHNMWINLSIHVVFVRIGTIDHVKVM